MKYDPKTAFGNQKLLNELKAADFRNSLKTSSSCVLIRDQGSDDVEYYVNFHCPYCSKSIELTADWHDDFPNITPCPRCHKHIKLLIKSFLTHH